MTFETEASPGHRGETVWGGGNCHYFFKICKSPAIWTFVVIQRTWCTKNVGQLVLLRFSSVFSSPRVLLQSELPNKQRTTKNRNGILEFKCLYFEGKKRWRPKNKDTKNGRPQQIDTSYGAESAPSRQSQLGNERRRRSSARPRQQPAPGAQGRTLMSLITAPCV